jgi:gluconolactonase
MSVEVRRFSTGLDRIVPDSAPLERLATGFHHAEGPVWESTTGTLYFNDVPAGILYRWQPGEGLSPFRDPSGNANGLTLDHKGRLLVCESGNRRVTRYRSDGSTTVLAAYFRGRRLNSPNDIVVKSDGIVYFTDPSFGPDGPLVQELPFQGVYRLDPATCALRLVVDDFALPNGLALSPDERILYIDDTARRHVRAFDVLPDGTLAGGRIFAKLDPRLGEGRPDGMKVDTEGNLYVAGPGGIWVISPAGERLGVLLMPEVTANLAWGGEDGRTLFITATTSLYSVRLKIPGRAP